MEDACADARAADGGRAISARVTAPLVVTGDEMRLRQVLSNLLRNALVHTPAGTPVEVGLHRDDGHAVLEVIDHGPGIPTSERERIFERFHRMDRDRGQPGLGLGLSIVRGLVKAARGDIWIDDAEEGGAAVRVSFPAAEPGRKAV